MVRIFIRDHNLRAVWQLANCGRARKGFSLALGRIIWKHDYRDIRPLHPREFFIEAKFVEYTRKLCCHPLRLFGFAVLGQDLTVQRRYGLILQIFRKAMLLDKAAVSARDALSGTITPMSNVSCGIVIL